MANLVDYHDYFQQPVDWPLEDSVVTFFSVGTAESPHVAIVFDLNGQLYKAVTYTTNVLYPLNPITITAQEAQDVIAEFS